MGWSGDNGLAGLETELPFPQDQAAPCGPRPVLLTGLLVFQNQLSGNLLRKFKNSNGWQKLWVVFTNFCLFFYKSHQVRASHRAGDPWDRTFRVQAGESLGTLPSRGAGSLPLEGQRTSSLTCPDRHGGKQPGVGKGACRRPYP